MKILKIEEDVPQIVTLPDGTYTGEWGGYIIKLHYKGKNYNLTTEVGVKGMGIKVIVTIVDGVATYSQSSN